MDDDYTGFIIIILFIIIFLLMGFLVLNILSMQEKACQNVGCEYCISGFDGNYCVRGGEAKKVIFDCDFEKCGIIWVEGFN